MSLWKNCQLLADFKIRTRQTQVNMVRLQWKRKFSFLLTRTSLSQWQMLRLKPCQSLAVLATESRCLEAPWIHLPWEACAQCLKTHRLSFKTEEKILIRHLIWRITKSLSQRSMSICSKKAIHIKKVSSLLSANLALTILLKFWGKIGKMIKS